MTEVATDTPTPVVSQRIVITDVDIPIGSMVNLLVKLAFAAIPAIIIIGMVMALLGALLGGISMLGLS